MVNTGQPSTACIQCRFRRIKCDATKPHCDCCTKYGIVCPGYPEKSLIFKDDTSVVRQRAERKYEKRRRLREAGESSSESSRLRPTPVHTESSTSSRSDPDLPQSEASESGPSLMQLPLLQPQEAQIVEEAVAAFLSQWNNPNVELWWDILNPAQLTNLERFKGDSLATALQAVSVMMVAIKQEPQSLSMMRSAAKIYGAALRSINKALQNPDEWLKDNTVLAVILTALFETMQEPSDDTLSTTHLRGMMTIINARGADQFRTVAGRRIFLYAYFSWTSNAMPDMAVMPNLANNFVPPLSEDVFQYLAQGESAVDEPALRLLPLINRSLLLRSTSIGMLQSAAEELNPHIPQAILDEVQTLDAELLAWNANLPAGWGEQDHLYQLLTTWFQTHRIFLADLSIRCLQLLAEVEQKIRNEQIWQQVDVAQNAVDEICVRAPYTFGEDKPYLRKPHIKRRDSPPESLPYLYHSSFDYPLLVASMVWTLPPFRQKGIEEARVQCASACGLKQPRKMYPKVLVYLTPQERKVYIDHRVERHQKWLQANGGRCPFKEIPGHTCDGSQ